MSLIVITPPRCKGHNYHNDSTALRKYKAAFATALDAGRNPTLADGWTGFLEVNGNLAINDNGEARRKAAHYFGPQAALHFDILGAGK